MIITIGRKPFDKTVSENTKVNGCGAINIDACRIGEETRFNASAATDNRVYGNFKGREGAGRYCVGRFPANVVLSHTAVNSFDKQSGICRSNHNKNNDKGGHQTEYVGGTTEKKVTSTSYTDIGGASRYFKVVGLL